MKRRHEGSHVSWWRVCSRPIDHETHFLLLYSLAAFGQIQCSTAGNGITETQAAPGCFIWSREGWELLESGENHLWPWWTSHQYRRYMIGRGRRESCLTIISKERPVARLPRRVAPKIDAIYPLLLSNINNPSIRLLLSTQKYGIDQPTITLQSIQAAHLIRIFRI